MKSTVIKLKPPLPTEGDECAALMQWAAITRYQHWRLCQLLVMIPNGAVLAGDAAGRPEPDAVTLFDSTGLAIQDLAVAAAALEALREGRAAAQRIVL